MEVTFLESEVSFRGPGGTVHPQGSGTLSGGGAGQGIMYRSGNAGVQGKSRRLQGPREEPGQLLRVMSRSRAGQASQEWGGVEQRGPGCLLRLLLLDPQGPEPASHRQGDGFGHGQDRAASPSATCAAHRIPLLATNAIQGRSRKRNGHQQ